MTVFAPGSRVLCPFGDGSYIATVISVTLLACGSASYGLMADGQTYVHELTDYEPVAVAGSIVWEINPK